VKWSEPETLVITEWNGKAHLEHRYQWVNDIENRAEGEKLWVNYLCFETYNMEQEKVVSKNSWITDKPIAKENVRLLAPAPAGR
jgi:hypothetical protein